MKNTFDMEDPRLTAFVLGELDAGERAAVERLIASDESARRFVEDLRRTADALAAELEGEPAPSLAANQRAVIEKRIARQERRGFVRRHPWIVAAAAALLVICAGAAFWNSLTRESEGPFFYDLFGGATASRPASPDPAGAVSTAAAARAPGAIVSYEEEMDSLRRLGYVRGSDTELPNTESYDHRRENTFQLAAQEALSTFSIDVDTASYTNARRFLMREGQLPPPSSVRIEEFVNYFTYDYPAPEGDQPFSVTTEVASCPWQPRHRLVHIGLRGKDIPFAQRPASNLVFLIDVSGSMDSPDKLPLLQRSMKLLVEQLDERDRVAIVVYAGASGLVLPSTSCVDAWAVMDALEMLSAGGSTNGGAGIRLAYQIARENLVKGGLNRVILCTDGDFNVGVTDEGSLVKLIEEERKSGVFLSVLGFGTGNLNDSTMEKLAQYGNGNYAYVDSLNEARRVLVAELGGTLLPVAKDVKIQVEFNPAEVKAWRLIGYENRLLAHQDFNDDTKDAGEIGAGVGVTALYEIVPHGVPLDVPAVDPLRYQGQALRVEGGTDFSGELMHLKLRYKPIDGDTSLLVSTPIRDSGQDWFAASNDFKFSAAVAGFAMQLAGSAYIDKDPFRWIRQLAGESIGPDEQGHRREFIKMVERCYAMEQR